VFRHDGCSTCARDLTMTALGYPTAPATDGAGTNHDRGKSSISRWTLLSSCNVPRTVRQVPGVCPGQMRWDGGAGALSNWVSGR
jgi:hypothetical protein